MRGARTKEGYPWTPVYVITFNSWRPCTDPIARGAQRKETRGSHGSRDRDDDGEDLPPRGVDIVSWIVGFVGALLLYSFLLAMFLPRWLERLPHERYDGRDVYVVDRGGRRLHVPEELLELYPRRSRAHGPLEGVARPLLTSPQMFVKPKNPKVSAHVGDARIQERTGTPPDPGVLRLWTYALGIPVLFARVIKTFRSSS